MLAKVVKDAMSTRRFFAVIPAVAAVVALLLPFPADAAKIKSRADKFDGKLHLSAPWKHKVFGGSFQLRARFNPKDGSAVYFVFVENEFFESNRGGYTGTPQGGANPHAFRNYNQAVDRDGQAFEVLPGAKSFDGCNPSFCYYQEQFAIVVPEAYLQQAAGGAVALRALSEARVAFTIEVPPDHVQSLTARVAQERAKTGR